MLFRSCSTLDAPDTYNTTDKIRRGNIKARLRMIALYDLAGTTKGMVLGTTNYTEALLDFFTVGGDGCVDYEPIYYLWKTEVYELAAHLLGECNEDQRTAMVQAIQCQPTDGLGISETDVDQFGESSYEKVDTILRDYISCDDPNTKKDLEDYLVVQRYLKRFKHNLPITPMV